MNLLQATDLLHKTRCVHVCGFIAVGVWISAVTLRRLSRWKILCQKQQAQAYFCVAPLRSVTVCDTVQSSPASVRTAFLWKYKTKWEWITQLYECKFCV